MTEKPRQHSLQREVLAYLAEYGPKNRARLYAGIDGTHTEEMGPVLDELKQLGYVEIRSNNTVLLTASGKAWLKSGKQAGAAAER